MSLDLSRFTEFVRSCSAGGSMSTTAKCERVPRVYRKGHWDARRASLHGRRKTTRRQSAAATGEEGREGGADSPERVELAEEKREMLRLRSA
jgi:hypothetical protein